MVDLYAHVGGLALSTIGSSVTATLWVNGLFGSNSLTRAQVRAGGGTVAWQTIGRAAWGSATRSSPVSGEAAEAGDVVAIAAGNYASNVLVSSNSEAMYNTVNEGSVGNPITFVAVGGTVRLTSTNANSPAIGAKSKDYIKWYADRALGNRFYLVCDGRGDGAGTLPDPDDTKGDTTIWNTKGDTGPVVVNDSIGSWVEGVDIDGGVTLDYTDNWPGVRIENSDSVTIRNCKIYSFHNATDSANSDGLNVYNSQNCIIEHNWVYDIGTGIATKDTDSGAYPVQGNIYRFNRFEDTTHGAFGFSLTDQDRNYIYQNLCVGCGIGWYTTGGNQTNDWIYNNTFVNCGNGTYVQTGVGTNSSGVRLWNNIFTSTVRTIEYNGVVQPAATRINLQHNVSYQLSGGYYAGSDGNKDFATYNSTYADQNDDLPISVNADPLFTNAGAGDYTLQAGSPARNLGRHPNTNATMHAGCYQTMSEVMGLES